MSVSKKAEKLTTALYMLTDLINEEDPMRHRIRQVSLSILSDTRALSYSVTGDLYFHMARVISKGWEIVSLMEVSVVVGFISDMNYQVLKNALIDFIGDLRNRQRIEGFNSIRDMKFGEGEAGNLNLKSDFFKLSDKDFLNIKEESGEGYAEKKESVQMARPVPVAIQKDTYKGQDIKRVSLKNSEANIDGVLKIEERKQKILSLITDKKDISIKDIVSYFAEYSQKTIQRDLAALVSEGRIKRTGEKRWSRYGVL